MKTVLTHTGKIYVDTEHRLECRRLWYNIKADFLGLTKEINGVENTAKQEMGSNSERLSYAL